MPDIVITLGVVDATPRTRGLDITGSELKRRIIGYVIEKDGTVNPAYRETRKPFTIPSNTERKKD